MTETSEQTTTTNKAPETADAPIEALEQASSTNGAPASPASEDSLLNPRLGEAPEEERCSVLPEDQRLALARKKVGTSLKGWRVHKLIGVGRTTASYEAVKGAGDAGERAVIRMLIGDVARSSRARSHFLRAAYAANRFTHPRVMAVTADGTDEDGTPFTVRSWLEAESLTSYAVAADLDEQRVLRIAEQLLDILEIAHAHGIVHGAITPSNVLVTARGSIRLIDFAVPPSLSARKDSESPLPPLRVGPYTPPERRTEEISSATEQGDIWAVAALMFYALKREPPPGNVGTSALAENPPIPLREVLRGVAEPLASVIEHALAPDPACRYDSAYAMLGDVRRVLAGRAPKLVDASGPVPSGVLADTKGPPSSFRPPAFHSARSAPGSQRAKGSQWQGNLGLVVLIALLMGAAAYVMIREKSEEHRQTEEQRRAEELRKAEERGPAAGASSRP